MRHKTYKRLQNNMRATHTHTRTHTHRQLNLSTKWNERMYYIYAYIFDLISYSSVLRLVESLPHYLVQFSLFESHLVVL